MTRQFTFLIFFLPFVTFGQTVTWDGGGGNTDWHNPLNWNTNTVPCITCTAVVDGAVVVNVSASDTIKELKVNNGAFFFVGVNVTLGVQGSSNTIEIDNSNFSNNGNLNVTNFTNRAVNITNNGIFDNFGNILIAGDYTGINESGIIINDAQFHNKTGATLGITNLAKNPFRGVTNSIVSNRGQMLISDCNDTGIYTSSNFENFESGTITINNTVGYGLINFGILTNKGEITISNILPSSSGGENALGINSDGVLINSVNATINISYTVQYGIRVLGEFLNDGDVFVEYTFPNNVGTSFGIQSAAELLNNGNITVSNISGVGLDFPNLYTPLKTIVNNGNMSVSMITKNAIVNRLNFLNNGEVVVDQSDKIGFVNSDTVINVGSIEISNTTDFGFQNNNFLHNKNTGKVYITASDSVGLRNFATNDEIVNDGFINIENTIKSGIRNSGNFSNNSSGIINLSDLHHTGILTSGTFHNNGGQVLMDSFNQKNNLSDGITNEGELINTGYIDIKHNMKYGIYHNSTIGNFLNDTGGEIHIQNSANNGLEILSNAENRGIIHIDSSNGSAGVNVLETTTTFLNSGLLKINNSENGLSTEGFVGNIGTITIDQVEDGIYVNPVGLFYNFPAGIVNLDLCNSDGLRNFNVFSNEGSLSISNLGGSGIFSRGLFSNYNTIQVISAGGIGIKNEAQGTNFTNFVNGNIEINFCGAGIISKDTLKNVGTIDLSSNANYGITNQSFFENTGKIEIENSYIDINNSSNGSSSPILFFNKSTGTIKLNNLLSISEPFTNDGLIVSDFDGVNIITGTFSNNGVYVDRKDKQVSGSNFVNNGLLIKPLKGKVSVGVKEMNIINRTGITTFSPANTWYISPQQTVLGGSFSATDDSFTPNANTPFADSLYFNVINATGVSHLIKLPILKIPSCPTNPTATFTQAVSTDWHIAENWDSGIVPDYCTIAIIPNTKKCTITTGRKARAFRILSDTGSVFDAELGVVLEVEN